MKPKTEIDRSPLSKERLRLWLKMIKTQASIENEVRGRLRDQFGTTLPRFDVMSALARSPQGLKMSEISGLLKVSNGNVTGIVDRLTADSLVIRLAIPGDRRAQLIKLTSAGREVFSQLAQEHETWLNDMLGGLDHDHIDNFSNLLDNVATHIEQDEAVKNA